MAQKIPTGGVVILSPTQYDRIRQGGLTPGTFYLITGDQIIDEDFVINRSLPTETREKINQLLNIIRIDGDNIIFKGQITAPSFSDQIIENAFTPNSLNTLNESGGEDTNV